MFYYMISFENGRFEYVSGNSFIEAFFEKGYRAGSLLLINWVIRSPTTKSIRIKYTQCDLARIHWELLSIEYMEEKIDDHLVLGSGFDRMLVIERMKQIIHSF